ncbi:SDR family NAD(P)-dependent oxidoreductase [Stenotrophomonas sp. NPDC087984]
MAVLEDKVAVVTVASTGIGFATARAFRDEGATVFITGRRKDALDAAVAPGRRRRPPPRAARDWSTPGTS